MDETILAPTTLALLDQLYKKYFLKEYYLVGGTALALQIGHRESEDLDFFTFKDFNNLQLYQELATFGKVIILSEDKNTLHINLNNVKVSFLTYSHQLLEDLIEYKVKVASIKDIACMKITAISSRGSKKDFVDLYYILKNYSLDEIFLFFNQKYNNIAYDKVHILKSLVYFEDADQEADPIMKESFQWEEIKKYFRVLITRY